MSLHIDLVRKFWQLIGDQRWSDVQLLLAPDFVAVWPQSREKMVGAESFVAVNKYYPGNHRVELVHIHEAAGLIFTTVWIEADTGQKTFANSYFEVKAGKISRAEEYWAAPYEAPAWRSQWVQKY